MKTQTLILPTMGLTALAAALLILPRALSVAEASPAPKEATGHGVEPWSFREGRGVLLSEAARRALGVEIASVESGAVHQEPERHSAQIYRMAEESPDGKAAASLWLPPPQAAAFSIGQTVEVRYQDAARPAKVMAKRDGFNKATSPVEILIEVEDQKKTLRLGDFVAALFQTSGKPRESTFVRSSAVVESVRGTFVYALNGESYLRTPVKLGTRSGDRVEILDGLFEGDEVVTRGAKDIWLVELQAVNGGKGCADGH
jgi:multidrug efflux pump subunit AcrA (membrane-fusion protein)